MYYQKKLGLGIDTMEPPTDMGASAQPASSSWFGDLTTPAPSYDPSTVNHGGSFVNTADPVAAATSSSWFGNALSLLELQARSKARQHRQRRHPL